MIPGDAPLGEPIESLRFAAVVVLLHEGEHCSAQGATDPRLVLIERSSRLRAHAGQLAFPGGKPEPQDGGELWTTAHREAHEEVGLHAPHRGAPSGQKLELLGRLDTVPTDR